MTRNVNIKTAGSNPSQVCEGTLEQKEDGSSLLTSHCEDGSYSVAHTAPQKIVNGQDMSQITRGSLKNNEDGSYLATSTDKAGGYSVDYRAPGNTALEKMNGQLTGRLTQDEVVSMVSNSARENNIEGLSWSRSTDGSNAMIASDGHGSQLQIGANGSFSVSVGGGKGGAFENLAKSLRGDANVSGSVSSNVSAPQKIEYGQTSAQDVAVAKVSEVGRTYNVEGLSWSRSTDGSNAMIASDRHGSQLRVEADGSMSGSLMPSDGFGPIFGSAGGDRGNAIVSGSVSSNVSAGENFTVSKSSGKRGGLGGVGGESGGLSWSSSTDGNNAMVASDGHGSIPDSVSGGRGGAYEQRAEGGNSADSQNKGAQAETADAGMSM